MAFIVFKSQIKGALLKAELAGYEKGRKEQKFECDQEFDDMRADYEIKIETLLADCKMMQAIADRKDRILTEARAREKSAQRLVLKAKEIVSKAEYKYRQHCENVNRLAADFHDIEEESQLFIQKLLPE